MGFLLADPVQCWHDKTIIPANRQKGKREMGESTINNRPIRAALIGKDKASIFYKDILENYPSIKPEDIFACLSYASALVHEERFYPLKTV